MQEKENTEKLDNQNCVVNLGGIYQSEGGSYEVYTGASVLLYVSAFWPQYISQRWEHNQDESITAFLALSVLESRKNTNSLSVIAEWY